MDAAFITIRGQRYGILEAISMIRKNKQQIRPLYREVIKESLAVAWHKRWLWPFAIVAGILQTGGILDVILYRARTLSSQGHDLATSPWFQAWIRGVLSARGSTLTVWFMALGMIQGILYASLLVGAFLAISVIAQGALVFGLGGRLRGRIPTFRECLTMGARAFWPVAALNVVTLGLLWLAHFLVLIPLTFSIESPTVLTVITYFLAYLLFLLAAVALTTIHLFALNAILLQEATLMQALVRSYTLFKRAWILVLETAGILLALGTAVMAAAMLLFLVAGIPVFVIVISAALLQYPSVVVIGTDVLVGLFGLVMLTAGAFTIVFQYATWGRLYIRLGEGGAIAKLHRWYLLFKGEKHA